MSKSTNIWLSYNRKVIEWTRETWEIASRNLQSSIKNGTDTTITSLMYKNGRDRGLVDYAALTFDRVGIMIEKGVGGVYTINPEGSGIVTRKTPGGINRQPQPWLAPTMEGQLGKLTVTVSEEFAKVLGESVPDSLQKSLKVKGLK
jgi:hypothetical protein